MPGPIALIADVPTADPGLGFRDYVTALADAIRGGKPARFTVGLYGPWGSGKSSILAALHQELEPDSSILAVQFDAWRNERAEHVVVPLLHAVVKAGERKPGFAAAVEQVKRFLVATVRSLTVKTPWLEVDGDRFTEAFTADTMSALDEVFSRPFAELRALPAKLDADRIVVLVDDLDRCSPAKVVDLLEAINLIMDVDGFVFVLALDYDVLVAAVHHKYPHVSGHAFIEKMIQVPFRVPPLRVAGSPSMVALVPGWQRFVHLHDEAAVDAVIAVSKTALRGNPRELKRLVNYVLVLERVVENRDLAVTTEHLVSLVALQLAWPETYAALAELGLTDGGGTPEITELFSTSPTLRAFADTHLNWVDSPDLLEEVLQLASAVETGSLLDAKARPSSWSKSSRREVTTNLTALGFVVSMIDAVTDHETWVHSDRDAIAVHVRYDDLALLRRNAETPLSWVIVQTLPSWAATVFINEVAQIVGSDESYTAWIAKGRLE